MRKIRTLSDAAKQAICTRLSHINVEAYIMAILGIVVVDSPKSNKRWRNSSETTCIYIYMCVCVCRGNREMYARCLFAKTRCTAAFPDHILEG